LVKQLKLVDKVRLIERVAPQIERELAQMPVHRKSLPGLWRVIDISKSEIAEVRGRCADSRMPLTGLNLIS
jgi:hypothetical protein